MANEIGPERDPLWRRVLHKLGVSVTRLEKRNFQVRLRRRFYYIVFGALGGGLIFLLASAKYSESPRFCHSCHIMEPYYRAWKTSKHNSVACVECHYPPGSPRTILWKKFQALSQVVKYVTRTYSSRPFAEIEDAACLQCHSTRLLEGKVITKRGVNFDHKTHLTTVRRGRQLVCTSCHAQMVVGNHMEVSYDTCYLCHFKGMGEGKDLKPVGGCLGCHNLPAESFRLGNMTYNHKDFVNKRGLDCMNCHVNVVQGKGEATQDRCFTCHNQPEKLAKIGDIPFIHETHVTKHNVACYHCHKEIRHSLTTGGESQLARLDASTSPVAAPGLEHPDLPFDCSYCHQSKHGGQIEMYTGKTKSLDIPEMPSPMYEAQVDCVGCHYQEENDPAKEFRGKTFRASDEACVKCHGPKFKGIWQDTRQQLKDATAQLRAKAAQARIALAAAGTGEGARAAGEKLRLAERWLTFVESARGEHNIYLAADTLRRVEAALNEAGEALHAKLPDVSAQPLISGSFCATLCHQRVGVKVPPETVTFEGKTMPHRKHGEMLGCSACHVIGAHKKVPLKPDYKAVCAGCHPN